MELLAQGAGEIVPSVFQAVVALEPAAAADLSKLVDNEHEPETDGLDRDEILVCRAYDEAVEDLYRRAARVYRRQTGLRAAS